MRDKNETPMEYLWRSVEGLRQIAATSNDSRMEINLITDDIASILLELGDDEETLRRRAAELELMAAEYRLDTARMERELLMRAGATPQTRDSLSRVGPHASAVSNR